MSAICQKIHSHFSLLPRFSFPFDSKKIPANGIYILFEKGEKAHGTDRIVRIGTHTGSNQLPSRLNQHFLMENKDRSIFRKNIGRALLNKNKDTYAEMWERDLTTRSAKKLYKDIIDIVYQQSIEKQVTDYIQKAFSFCIIQVEDKDKRLSLESKIISTVSLCEECLPSKNWLGLYSPKEKIRESGLWLVNELYKEPLNDHLLTKYIISDIK